MSDFITVAELRIEAERLCDENERLEAENAKLRNDADLLRAMLSQERLEKQCYMAENAKLLELVEDMLDCIQIRAAFSRPPTEEMYEMFYKRARELGVDE